MSENGNVTYTVKEMIANLDGKIDTLSSEIKNLTGTMSILPAVYVSKSDLRAAAAEARLAKRFALTAVLMSIGALGTFVGLVF